MLSILPLGDVGFFILQKIELFSEPIDASYRLQTLPIPFFVPFFLFQLETHDSHIQLAYHVLQLFDALDSIHLI